MARRLHTSFFFLAASTGGALAARFNELDSSRDCDGGKKALAPTASINAMTKDDVKLFIFLDDKFY
jgi:hypothetical protein